MARSGDAGKVLAGAAPPLSTATAAPRVPNEVVAFGLLDDLRLRRGIGYPFVGHE